MSSLIRHIIDVIKPRGALWRPVIGGYFDKFFDGYAATWEPVREYFRDLAFVRDPWRTPVLDSLEREFGRVPPAASTKAERRAALAAQKYRYMGTGSEDDLEEILRAAGFDVRVNQNDPAIDPEPFLGGDFQCIANNTTAVAGNDAAFAGITGGGQGELIVNDLYVQVFGAIICAGATLASAGNDAAFAGSESTVEKNLIEYDVSLDSSRWNFIFFIAGAFTGWTNFEDPDMEDPTTLFWPSGPATSAVKDQAIKSEGTQSIKVTAVNNTATPVEVLQPDPSLLATYDMEVQEIHGVADRVPNLAWFNRVVDGSMEKNIADIADWGSSTATLSKETAAPSSGNQNLKVTATGAGYCYASQSIFSVGKATRVLGKLKSDGAMQPRIGDGSAGNIFNGDFSTSWQTIDGLFIPTNALMVLNFVSSGAGDYCEFDSVAVYEYPNLLVDDASAVNGANVVDDWVAGSSGVLTKPGGGVLRVTGGGVAQGHARFDDLISGGNYRISGEFRGDGSTGLPYLACTGGDLAEVGTISNTWQSFDEEFIPTGAFLYLFNNPSTGYSEFRNLILIDLDAGASTHSASYSNQLVDGDCESLTGWSTYGSPTSVALDASVVYKGSNSIAITNLGTNGGIYQAGICTIGKKYRLRGHLENVASVVSEVKDAAAGSVLWTSAIAGDFENIDVIFTAATADLYFGPSTTDLGVIYCDDFLLEELSEHNTDATASATCKNSALSIGNAIDFDGTAAKVTGSTDVSPFAYQTHSIGCWFTSRSLGSPSIQGLITNNKLSSNTDSQYLATAVSGAGYAAYAYCDGTSKQYNNAQPIYDDSLYFVSVDRIYDGTGTTVKVYLNGEEFDDNYDAVAPDVSVIDFIIGFVQAASSYYHDGLISITQGYNEGKGADFWLAQYERGFAAMQTNPSYVEQVLATPVVESVPLVGSAWSDGVDAAPLVQIREPGSSTWIDVWSGTKDDTAEQTIAATLANGLAAIRLGTAGVENGSVNFDAMSILDQDITKAQIAAERRDEFRRLVLQYKPERSWALALVDYV